MDKPLVVIKYKRADGSRTSVEVTPPVKELLEQSDRQIRSQRRQDRRYLDDAEYVDGLTDTTTKYPQEDTADLVIRMDSYKRLYAAIDMLPEPQRRRVQLYYFGGFTYCQMAEFEGVHNTSVMRAIKKAHKSLKELLQ
jgi:DNA-directed RNA polymerase specialized sigma24 family protein